MAYFTQKVKAEESDFEYPPPPDTYTNPYAMFNASNAYISHHTPVLEHDFVPSYDHSPGHQAMAFSSHTPSSQSSPVHGLEFRVPKNIAPVPLPNSSYDLGSPSPSMSIRPTTFSPAPGTKVSFIQYPSEVGYRRRPRGTTGRIVCDECGGKFTVLSSLNRHKKTCLGKKPAKISTSSQHEPIKPPNAIKASEQNNDALQGMNPSPVPSGEQSRVEGPNSILPTMPAAGMVTPKEQSRVVGLSSNLPHIPVFVRVNDALSAERAWSIQSYVPRGPDISADYKSYFCDLCPEIYARRDLLQAHKAEIHGLVEIPFLLDPGTMDRPQYLMGVTYENSTQHSRRALKIWETGGLSPSPCQHCVARGLGCMVNPSVSNKCSYCSYRDSGGVCGAAGVKYM